MKGPIAKEEVEQDSCSSIDVTSYEYCPLRNMKKMPLETHDFNKNSVKLLY